MKKGLEILMKKYLKENEYYENERFLEGTVMEQLYKDLLKYLKKHKSFKKEGLMFWEKIFMFKSLDELDEVFANVLGVSIENASSVRKYTFFKEDGDLLKEDGRKLDYFEHDSTFKKVKDKHGNEYYELKFIRYCESY